MLDVIDVYWHKWWCLIWKYNILKSIFSTTDTVLQYCAKVLSHHSVLYIVLGKLEIVGGFTNLYTNTVYKAKTFSDIFLMSLNDYIWYNHLLLFNIVWTLLNKLCLHFRISSPGFLNHISLYVKMIPPCFFNIELLSLGSPVHDW